MVYTYIISNGVAVKIGRSIDVKRRVAGLQSGSSEQLTVLALIEGDCEKTLHQQFASSRLLGEWFSRSPIIDAFINDIRIAHYNAHLATLLGCSPVGVDLINEDDSLTHELRETLAHVSQDVDGKKRILISSLKKLIGAPLQDRRTGLLIAERMRTLGYRRINIRVRNDTKPGAVMPGYESI